MIPISAALKAHLARPAQTLCTILRVALTNGTVLGFTDHDQDIVYDDGDGAVTYEAALGYVRKDVAQAGDLSVDNSEYDGILNSPSINEADLATGIWDYAALRFSLVNWVQYAVTSITRSGTTATMTLAVANADLQTGDNVCVLGATQSQYNGFQTLARISNTQFTYPVSGSPATPATGAIYYMLDLLRLPGWRLGQVTVGRNMFTTEIRGIMQAYTRTIGELTQPGCRAQLYDARCKVNPASFTVMSTLTGVSADQLTLYDTARTEPGPSGNIAITAITQSNPGHVTLADASSFSNGEPILLYGITGGGLMPTLNAQTIIRNIDYTANTFDLGISTVGYGAYGGGGQCVPLGASSGYFDFGLITFTSGANAGLSGEVRNYAPGVWTLELPFPYAINVGDAYTMLAGCDKSLSTCKTKFSNVINMRGEPYLPGIDKITQVGKQP